MYPTEKNDIKQLAKLKNEVEHYFYFSKLLQKDRSDEAKKKVQEVIKRIPNVLARINEIEEIDNEDYEKNPEYYESETPQEKLKPTITFEKYQKENIEEIEEIKMIKPSGFFQFLFKERSALKDFSEQSQMLTPRFFALFFRLSPHFFRSFENLNKEIDVNIMEALKHLLEYGWETLSKEQYNVCYVFYNFLRRFISFSANVKHPISVPDLVENLNNVIPLYLQLLNDEKYKTKLVESIQLILASSSVYKTNVPVIIDLILRVFNLKTSGKTNFFQIFISIYNLFFRKILFLTDLLNHFKIKEIPTDVYVCDNKIAFKIDERIEKIENDLEESEEELFLIKNINSKLDFFNFQDNDFLKISSCLIKNAKSADRHKIDEKKVIEYFANNLLYGVMIYAKGFVNVYSDILIEQITIKKEEVEEEVKIFDKSVFQESVSKLNSLIVEIGDFKKLNPHISITSQIYENFLKTYHLEIEKDEKACTLILDVLREFFYIYLTLTKFLYFHYRAIKNSANDPFKLQKKINKVIKKDDYTEDRVIPYYYYKVKDENFADDTVVNVLNDISYFTGNFDYIFELHDIINLTKKKDILLNKSEQLIKEKTRYI